MSLSISASAYFCSFWFSLTITLFFSLGSDVICPSSDPFGLYNLAQQVLIFKSHLLFFTLLFSSVHPTIQWLLEPRRRELSLSYENRTVHCWSAPDLTCRHSYGHPYLCLFLRKYNEHIFVLKLNLCNHWHNTFKGHWEKNKHCFRINNRQWVLLELWVQNKVGDVESSKGIEGSKQKYI